MVDPRDDTAEPSVPAEPDLPDDTDSPAPRGSVRASYNVRIHLRSVDDDLDPPTLDELQTAIHTGFDLDWPEFSATVQAERID